MTRGRQRALVPTLLLLTTVTGVVSSLGAPLVPSIAGQLDVDVGAAQWTLTTTLLAAAVATPVLGRLGVAHLRRRVILGGLLVVLVGLLLAALATSLPLPGGVALGTLVSGRALQGVGMALVPLVMSTARDQVPIERLSSVMALLSVGGVTGAGLGFPLTALVAQVGGVAAAFWAGTALVAMTAVATAWVLRPEAPGELSRPPWTQMALLAVATASLLLGITRSTAWGWADPRVLGLAAAGVLGCVAWGLVTLRSGSAVVDLRAAWSGPARGAHVTALLAGAGMYFGLTLVMLLVQADSPSGWGLDQPVLVAGLLLVPYSALSLVGSRLALLWGRRTDPARVLPWGCAAYLASTVLLVLAHDQVWQVLLAMALAGLGSGGTFATLPVLLVRAVSASDTASALAFNLVLRYVGFAAGSALGTTVLTQASDVSPDARGFVTAMVVNAALWALAILAVALTGRSRRHDGRTAT